MLNNKLENNRIDFEAMTISVNKMIDAVKAMIQDPHHRAMVELAEQLNNIEGKE